MRNLILYPSSRVGWRAGILKLSSLGKKDVAAMIKEIDKGWLDQEAWIC